VLLPNVGCGGWMALPNGLVWVGVERNPPKAGFWPKTDKPMKEESWLSDRIRKLQNKIF
jgi:hypothetical protein